MHTVATADHQGVPAAQIASERLWDLVEFLSAQRLSVHYSYLGEHFEVRFPRMSVAEVQRTLDQWANALTLLAA